MALEHVMLGLLNEGAQTGYDLKKAIAASPWMHWSGNNNQIYKALLKLSEAKLVSMEVVHQEKGPTKKVFCITELGKERLREWLMEEPEPTENRSGFLIRFALSHALRHSELEALILGYEERLRVSHLVAKNARDASSERRRSSRRGFVESCVDDYSEMMIRTELEWLRRVRSGLPSG